MLSGIPCPSRLALIPHRKNACSFRIAVGKSLAGIRNVNHLMKSRIGLEY